MTADEPTSFLYPFIEADERDAAGLLDDLAASARAKVDTSHRLQRTTLATCEPELARAGAAMARRFRAGGRLFTFGNGGSATDAEGAADMFRHPPGGCPLPAVSLVDDRAVLTALANDVGYELVFSRQIIAHGRPCDMALAFSTSGGSVNVLRGLSEAAGRGLLTVGLSGYEGGPMAASDDVHHSLVVRADSVHRIQESQSALTYELWSVVQRQLAAAAARDRPERT
jgi:D-sedoheptulose 7-phosphate isomerase